MHDQCNKEATATDVLKDTIPDTFSAVQTCYLDYTNSTDSANSALLSIVAIFSLIYLTSWNYILIIFKLFISFPKIDLNEIST